MGTRRPKTLELGLFLLVVAVPLVFTPFTAAPFADAKLLLLTVGTLCLWLGRGPVDRGLALLAGGWVVVTGLATAFGSDPGAGLTAATRGGGGGLVLTVCAATLLVVGAGLPPALLERCRGWLAWTGVAVAVMLLAQRVAPHQVAALTPRLSLAGVTFGNALFAGAFVAACMAAAADRGRPVRATVQLAVMGLGVSAVGERSAVLLPLVALIVVLLRGRVPGREAARTLGIFVAMFVLWQLAEPALTSERPGTGATAQFGSVATDADRFVVWGAVARGWAERPVLGWGPAMTHTAYLRGARTSDLAAASRPWYDGHDLLLETVATTGLLGLAALLLLLGVAVRRALRAPPDMAWAVGVAAALGAFALFEPLNLALTPLLFLFTGVAAGAGRTPTGERPIPAAGTFAAGIGACLAIGVVLAGLQFGAALEERTGTDDGDVGALRTAAGLAPWRVSATEELARQLAVASGSGDPAAGEEALDRMRAAIDAHPWDADVRPIAATVATLADRPGLARSWLVAQLARFPADTAFVAEHVNAPPT